MLAIHLLLIPGINVVSLCFFIINRLVPVPVYKGNPGSENRALKKVGRDARKIVSASFVLI